MGERLKGTVRRPGVAVEITFEVAPSLTLREVALGGNLREALPPDVLVRLASALEGAPLDRAVLTAVVKRAFQRLEVAVEGVRPEDVVDAALGAEAEN